MRAHTITTKTRPSRNARYRVLGLVLGICALAIPATASAYTDRGGYSSANAITGGSSDSSQPVGDSDYSSVNSIAGGSSESSDSSSDLALRRDGSKAVPFVAQVRTQSGAGSPGVEPGQSSLNAITGPPASEPTVVAGSPADTADGFDWGDAALGAGAAMALASLGGAAFLTVRRRTAVSPSATTG
jgi:hypothetical protein